MGTPDDQHSEACIRNGYGYNYGCTCQPRPQREPEWVKRAKEGRLPNSDRTGQVAA